MKIKAVVKINKVLLYIKQETKNHWTLVSLRAAMQRKASMNFCFVCLIVEHEITADPVRGMLQVKGTTMGTLTKTRNRWEQMGTASRNGLDPGGL